MNNHLRMSEFKLQLLKETDVPNGGLEINLVHRDGDLTAIKVHNTNYISGFENNELQVNDEWLYTLYVRDNVVCSATADTNYYKFVYENLVGTHLLEDLPIKRKRSKGEIQ